MCNFLCNVQIFVVTPSYECSEQAVGTKARKLGMTRIIRKSPVVRSLIRKLCVLPLLPQSRIREGYVSIGKEIRRSKRSHVMLGLMQYWVRTWRPKMHVLSVSGCTDRTNNASEIDNKLLQDSMRQKRPNVWDFIGEFLVAPMLRVGRVGFDGQG